MFTGPSQPANAPLGGVQGYSATADHTAALLESQRLAAYTGRTPGSAEVLLALVRVGGAASRLLQQRGINSGRLEAFLSEVRPEPPHALAQLEAASYDIARDLGSKQVSSLHLLVSILRCGGAGIDLLRVAGHDPAKVRAVVMRALTGPGRFGDRFVGRDREIEQTRPRTPAPEPPQARTPSAIPALEPRTPRENTGRRLAVTVSDRTGTALPPELPPELIEVGAPIPAPLHRERELGRLLDLVRANPSRIPCVVGEPGAGRSLLVEALSAALPKPMLTPSEGPAGASPGAWLQALHRLAAPDRILVLDGAGALCAEGSDGPAQLLAAAKHGRRWLLVATPADLRRFEVHAAELASRLEIVSLAALRAEPLLSIIEAGLQPLGEQRSVRFASGVAKTLMRLSCRYPSDRSEPGRALAIADLAAARAQRLGTNVVSDDEVAAVIADAAGVAPGQLLRTDDERYRRLDELMSSRIVGHDAARARITDLLRRSYAGFRGQRPLASLLLLGPTGVGKTETARAMADALFDGHQALVRIDLSEYNEPHSVARLVGSPPGYVAYEEGGQLTEAIRRRPASVVLLDEFEKAHRDVLLLLLQVLEDGRLTDGRGRTVDFSSAAIVMTSNLGSELYRQGRTPAEGTVLALARSRLPAELWNRMDEVLCYGTLGEPELRAIVLKLAEASSQRLEAERSIRFSIDQSVVNRVLTEELDRSLGARPLRRAFERLVEGPLAVKIVEGELRPGMAAKVAFDARGNLRLTLV
ncbi:MAG: AAA family ATPase [Deltaproteobacteria bacterium]|nr:AAA family ATPase [Deltaproteobacteria bacterium]